VSADAAYSEAGPVPGVDGKVEVQDADRVRTFKGFLMHRVSTEVAHKPQWLEIEAYKVTDGTCRYVLHFTGRSVLYHASGSDCNTGVPTQASKLPMDSEPCRRCRPGNFRVALADKLYEAETDRHKIEVCDGRPKDSTGALIMGDDGDPLPVADEDAAWMSSAREMLRILRESWHRKPETAGTLSAPAQRLVDTIARLDPAILAATRVVEEL
jgi:hypothetical protein